MIWACAVMFWLIETGHFGWHALPASDAEVICDGIVFVLLSIAYINGRIKQ